MYPTRIGFQVAVDRINALRANGHNAEALVTSVFTLEKLMRRSMRLALISRGFTSDHAKRLLQRKGFKDLKEIWEIFDKDHQKLPAIVGARDWQNIPKAVEARNQLVHGHKVFGLSYCETLTAYVMTALQKLHAEVVERYGLDPWDKIKVRRKPQLQWLT